MRYYNRDARTSACRLIRKRKGSRAEGGGREERAVADVETMWKKAAACRGRSSFPS